MIYEMMPYHLLQYYIASDITFLKNPLYRLYSVMYSRSSPIVSKLHFILYHSITVSVVQYDRIQRSSYCIV